MSILTRLARALRALGPGLARVHGTRHDSVAASEKAWHALAHGKPAEALWFADIAVSADPTWADGQRARSAALRRGGDVAGARAALERGLSTAPDDPRLLVALGDLELEAEHYSKAESAFRRALALERGIGTRHKLGVAVERQGRLDEAEEILSIAAEADTGRADVLTALGITRFRRESFTGAADALDRAIAVDPTYGLAHYYRSLVYALQERWEDARESSRRAVELEPDNPTFRAMYEKVAKT